MNIDKALFLSLAASIAVACSPSGAAEDRGASAAASSRGEEPLTGDDVADGDGVYSCFDPTTETRATNDEREKALLDQLTPLDPLDDASGMETFCRAFATSPTTEDGMSQATDDSLVQKCATYAKAYIPVVAYTAFVAMKKASTSDHRGKWDAVYEMDRTVASGIHFTRFDEGRSLCGDAPSLAMCKEAYPDRMGTDGKPIIDGTRELRKACAQAVKAMKPDYQPRLVACLKTSDSGLYSCKEGFILPRQDEEAR